MPEEGVGMKDYLKMKFGTDDTDVIRKRSDPLRQAGEMVGISWNKERKMVNTINSHCLAELARAQGKGDAMIGEIFAAYFERGEDINNNDVLCKLAEKLGVAGARECLQSGAYRPGVVTGYEAAIHSGIKSVPHFTIRVGSAEPVQLSGAQSLDYFSMLISRLLQMAEVPPGTRVRVVGNRSMDGEVVGFEGDQGLFAVRPLEGPQDVCIQAPRERLEVLKVIPAGTEVELEGLKAAELNGQRGEVVRFHGEKGRFEVRLVGAASTKALRADNLSVLRMLLPGDEVELRGLKAEHLNGQRGEVLGYSADKERFEVRLVSSGEVKAIQGDKLQRVSDSAPTAAQES